MKALSPDNAVFSTINKGVDLIWLSILWSLVSLPMIFVVLFVMVGFDSVGLLLLVLLPLGFVTTGPASAALYYAVVKVIRHERSYATKCFFHSLKENFKLGAASSALFGLFIAILLIDLLLAPELMNSGETIGSIMTGVLLCIGAFGLFVLLWINPLLSRFSVSLKELFKNSLVLSMRNFIRTLIMAAFWIGSGYLIYNYLLEYIIFIPMFLPGVSALLRSFVIEPVFKKLVGEPEEDGKTDAWYAE